VESIVGIDIATDSLQLARQLAGPEPRCQFLLMNAPDLRHEGGAFDVVACVAVWNPVGVQVIYVLQFASESNT